MSLHFRRGSAFDYAAYMGKTNATLEGFKRQPGALRNNFIKLKNKLNLKGINHEHFLFANARMGYLSVEGLLGKRAFDIYETWAGKFGTKDLFHDHVQTEFLKLVNKGTKFANAVDFAFYFLEDEYDLEVVAYFLQSVPIKGLLDKRIEVDFIGYKIYLEDAEKLQRLYRYFGII